MNLIGLAAWLVLAASCGGSRSDAEVGGATAAAVREPSQALPKKPAVPLYLGTATLRAEVLSAPEEIRTGMMFRGSIGSNEAMLFVFQRPHQASFWMKNVTVPLSAAYLDPEGRILEIRSLEPGVEDPVAAKSDRVQFVIETGRGWFDRNHVEPGTLVRTEVGSLAETFLRRR